MRTFKITFLVSLLITGFSFAQETWEKIFEDEFNGSSLNSSVWTHETGTGSQYGLWGWGNGESQYYQSQNTTVSNGTAKIVAKRQNVGGMNYTSSRIKTDGKFTFKYGKVQARMKTVEGEGFWPAFWLLPSGGGWPCDGEIDIMEQWAHDGDINVTTGAAHVGTCGEGSTYRSFHHSMAGSYADDFHIYEVRWYPDYIAWYVDDQKVFQITPADYPNDRWPFNDKNWYIILNLAITGSGPNNNTQFPSQIEIDWVRVYQPSDGNFNGHVDISGCLDPNASNYNANANDQAIDQWGNALCVYSSCADAPSEGCLYSDAFAGWHDNFNANDCSSYGGTPCQGSNSGEIGCLDANASNYNSNAITQNYDQWDNVLCVYASCDDVPSDGCRYTDAFAAWHDNFNANDCVNYNGIPCEGSGGGNTGGNTGGNSGSEGCIDANATNYDASASTQSFDQYGNLTCIYASCNDIPEPGCIYGDGFGVFNPEFDGTACSGYGGTPCDESGSGNTGGNTGGNSNIEGCLDANADNYNAAATVQGLDQYGNIACNYSSCDDIPDAEGCFYTENYSAFHPDFNAANCVQYGGTPCEGSGGGNTGIEGCIDENASNYNPSATVQSLDQYGNLICIFTSCNDIPEPGCIYSDGFGVFNPEFDGTACSGYGGTPCEGSFTEVPGCTDNTALNFNPNATQDNQTCEYSSCKPNWDFITTDQNHSIFINGTWTDVDGNPMKEGSVIGVFYEDDNGNLKSAGWAEFEDGTVQIAAMGDDSSSPETDGLTSNQEFIYRVWDAELCEEFSASITYSGGVETYTTNGITFISSITATETPSGPTEQELNLVKGWSIISTFMIPQDKDLGIILEPIIDKVIIAKDYAGAAYLPEYNFNGIGNVVVGQGYQIKTSEACDLTIFGDYAAPEQNPISCVQGWNMIGYLRTESAPCDMVLADMVDKVIIAKNSSGAAYLPEWSFNGIGHMKPGEGYQIKITDSGTLHYHSNDDAYRFSSLELTQNHTQHFPRVAPTDHNMTVIIEDEAWDIRPEIGSEIAAYDALGTIIGSAAYSRPLSVLSIWGDDATTSSKEGMKQKEIVSFKTWTSGKTTNFSVKDWKEGSEAYQSNAINIATAIESHSELTNSTSDDKSLVKIINLLGQEIKDPKDRFNGSVLFYLYENGSVDKVVK